ncbi:MAG: hypothetical protein U1A16_01005, partial [Patescibacteria group bacterium]|nr:hypothetical protein [Patescibacteria group bacterium]
RVSVPDKAALDDVKRIAPDVCIATPVNMRYSSADLEYLKAAISLGVPTAIPVYSWDNLTTKGVFQVLPDRVLVWNRAQIAEAVEHQDVSPERMRIVGAPQFDVWFSGECTPTPRAIFLQRSGLESARPFVVYLGSSRHIAKDETWFLRRFWGVLRAAADERLRTMQVIVRPHPANAEIYGGMQLEGVVVYPPGGSLPDTAEALQVFTDTLHHAVAAVGINNSAMIEAIIADKPVVSPLLDRYVTTQKKAEHFRLLAENQALEIVRSDEDMCRVLAALLDGRDGRRELRRRFIEKFIRPYGIGVSAGERVVAELEELVGQKSRLSHDNQRRV